MDTGTRAVTRMRPLARIPQLLTRFSVAGVGLLAGPRGTARAGTECREGRRGKPFEGRTLQRARSLAWEREGQNVGAANVERVKSLAAQCHRVLLATIFALASAAHGEITWSVPEDGGTPRDADLIRRIGPTEFDIRAAFEEGGNTVLRHAVSRLDLICRNSGGDAQEVTVHLDLSDNGRRTDYDNRPEAGMPTRDFLFLQPPGQEWRQVDGRTERWIATVRFAAVPGDTRVGLSPWYTYADYLRFLRGLPRHPHLKLDRIGTSEGGREAWELTVTDPDAPAAEKRTIFWHAREHAYETWSSFAMEGLIEYLLSEDAAEFRRRFRIVLHPMTNVDGVARGFEYRAGYDFPDPRGSPTGRLAFETVDRLRPDFAVAWHNWIAPRDRNVVFYTDGEDGRPTARAWWRFTQLFPSLRAADHRWKDEATPLKYNWEGRRPLSEANLHQYAMKRCGTRVWGWEMPWWNFRPADARHLGEAFGRAFLTTLEEIRRGGLPVEPPSVATVEVPKWEMHEFSIRARAHVANPWRDGMLVGEFVSPSGRSRVVDGFHDGEDLWRLRFAPDEEGEWRWRLRGEGIEGLQQGVLRCLPARAHGFLRVHPENPYALAHEDGAPFLPMGDTCYGLFDDSSITPELRARYLETRRRQGFNFVRFTVGHSEYRAAADSNYWAWGGRHVLARTPTEAASARTAADLDRFNPAFFRAFDDLLRDLRARGMFAELILLNFYRKPFNDPESWTPARERQWLRYLLARYSAFDTVFLWTLANEYETHPDGRYRLDVPADLDWVRTTANFLKANDAHRHLVTVHPVVSASRQGDTPRAPFDPPWRIGEFFGNELAIDVLSQQTGALDDGLIWDKALNCWTGDPVHVAASVAADRRFKKPVLNSENGYEYLRGHPTERKQVHHTDKVRRTAWRIVCAGGYFAAGFHGTIGHGDIWNHVDAPNRYTFEIRDEGAPEQLGHLHAFFSALPYWRLQPQLQVDDSVSVLLAPGEAVVAYLPRGGTTLLPSSLRSPTGQARWFDPRHGTFGPATGRTDAEGRVSYTAPGPEDWVLLLQ